MNGRIPISSTSSNVPLAHSSSLDREGGVLFCEHNSGFFSICTVAMWGLSDALQATGRWPKRIDFSQAFSAYRTAAQVKAATDLQPVFFQRPADPPPRLPKQLPKINHHGLYPRIDFRSITPVLEHYFKPGHASLQLQQQLIERYSIDLSRTIAVVYRGTDKNTEVKLAAPYAYLAQARELLDQHPDFRVLIQTDERSVRDLFCREIGTRCFFIEEMPTSTNGVVVHAQDDAALNMSRSDFGVLLVAVTHLLSRCQIIVNHTGNMALWICLWRGHARGVVQFDDEGGLVDFMDPAFYWRRTLRLARKIAGRLGLAHT